MKNQALDAIASILTPAEPNLLGNDLLELYSMHPQDELIVILPPLTPRQLVQLILILQDAQGEEWTTVDLHELVTDLHDRIRENWNYAA